ncbi:hypothetical protein [Basilea psittacipulmonis]|uniref:Uncharacterized protein n=1 Tax=Basilea psittacipulmonis DSM 24701 TaxID=1072685 RepID=A0A077DG42_9BURK|nr:hypothetical protein [Basilea psittacipulmonis]AIL32437.1 hypothetical protein IX83_03150 [Basilea psittacipulmonis DSM 24701]
MFKNSRDEDGQVLVLALILLSVIIVAIQGMYEVMQEVDRKIKLTQVSDLAAFSAANAVATNLNTQAFINQAQLSHQMAVGNLVTLLSLAKYRSAMSERSKRMNPPVWLIGMHFGPAHSMVYSSAQNTDSEIRRLEKALSEHQQASLDLAKVARALHFNLKKVRDETIKQIVTSHYPEADGEITWWIEEDTVPDMVRWEKFTGNYHALIERLSKTYKFLSPRNKRRLSPNVLPQCTYMPPVLLRQGETSLEKNGLWMSRDSESFHKVLWNMYTNCFYREYPMGWGMNKATQYVDETNAPSNFASQTFLSWAISQGINVFTASNNNLANAWAQRDASTSQSSASLQRAVLHRKTGGFKLVLKEKKRVATSKGKVFYESWDGKKKDPSLYQAYWHGRLSW